MSFFEYTDDYEFVTVSTAPVGSTKEYLMKDYGKLAKLIIESNTLYIDGIFCTTRKVDLMKTR